MNKDELKTILSIALDGKKEPQGIFLSAHPLTGEKDRDGWYFFTSDHRLDGPKRMKLALLHNLARGEVLTGVTWHHIEVVNQFNVKIGNQVVVEVETRLVDALATRVMCADMTDYSGQGRSDLHDMQELLSRYDCV